MAFDLLRTLGVVLVFALHWSAAYMRFAPPWWYVVDPERSLGFTAIAALLDATAIPLLFGISGYFASVSIERHGALAFVRRRLVRLGVPMLVGVLLVAPPTTWLFVYSRGVPVDLWTFWGRDFWGPAFNQGVYWFLGVLLLFDVVAATLLPRVPRSTDGDASASGRPFPTPALLVPIGFTTVLAGSITLDTWNHGIVLSCQPARLPLYGCLFALGAHGHRSGWRPRENSSVSLLPDGVGLLVSAAAYVAVRFHPEASGSGRAVLAIAYSALGGQFVRFMFLAAPGWLKMGGPGARSLAANAFGIYLLHLPVLLLATLAARSANLSLWPKATLVGLFSFSATWALSALWRALRMGWGRRVVASGTLAS